MNTKSSLVILWDVMSTLVYDPIHQEIPDFFGLSLQELYDTKHPTAWVDFEHGTIDEARFYEIYFPDRPNPIDGTALREILFDAYRFLESIDALLDELHKNEVEMHALSNYPSWFEIIEEKLCLSRYLQWTFVSCKTGLRKPDPSAYLNAASTLNLAPQRCLFIDDRQKNCAAAERIGMDTILFEDAPSLRTELDRRGIL